MTVNWEFMDNMTPATATRLVDDLRAGKEVRSTRGPAHLHLARGRAGHRRFQDGLVDEGPAAGAPSLLGLRIAQERGWTAPEAGPLARPAARQRGSIAVTDTLTPVLSAHWDAERSWTRESYESTGGYARAAQGADAWSPTTSSPWSRTPACAAVAAPASPPA